MTSVDSRIVTMKFDGRQFQEGVAATISALSKLRESLSFSTSTKGLDDLKTKSDNFNMNQMEGSVNRVSAAFVALSTVAITALANITNKVVDAGLQFGKSLTLEPIMEGFKEYELKMGSIQTILANTQRYGTTLGEVSEELEKLNEYADKTIYNFGDMTKNIGLFTNAGIRIEDATSMIKGFSNAAAASGTSAEGAAGAAYQLSQALSAGVIRLMDWRSLQNVGMGNKNMQQGLIDIAEAMGTFEGKSITAQQAAENFNGSLEKEWLSADVMEQYLKIMANEVTPAQMKALGLTDEQIKRLQMESQTAEEAATKVRTWTQLIGTLKESVGSGWAETFGILIGDFDEATDLFSGISDSIGGLISTSADARNKLLQDWKDLGGRTALLDGLKNVFVAIGKVLGTVKDAFRDIFPRTTATELVELTNNFKAFTERLIPTDETLQKIRRTLSGVFAVFSIFGKVIKAVVGFVLDLAGALFGSSGGFLEFTAGIGDFLTGVNDAIPPFKIFEGLADTVSGGLDRLGQAFSRVGDFIKPVITWFQELIGSLSSGVGSVFSGFDFTSIFAGLNVGVLGALGMALRNLVSNGIGVNVGGGFLDGITDALDGLTGVLEGMQQNLKANALLKIAGAIALLTASIVVMASIEPAKLVKAMTGISVGFGILLGAMKTMDLVLATANPVKMSGLATALILLAAAALVLSAAVRSMAKLDWDELARGLTGVAVGLGIMVAAARLLSGNSAGMVRAGIGLIAMAIGLRIMASAITKMSNLSWDEIGRGLGGIAASLVVISGAIRLIPNMTTKAVGLIVLGAALSVIASAVGKFADLELSELGKGLLGIAGSLVIIAGAMRLMPANMIATSVGLIAVGVALNLLASALTKMGGMSWTEIAKGLVALGGALIILAGGLYLMTASLPGAAALAVAAASIALLTPALLALSGLGWVEILKSLLALAGALTVIGVAGALLTPVIPSLLGLGAAVALLGVGLALLGAGALAFATAFGVAVAAAESGADILKTTLDIIIGSIPAAMEAFGEGVVAFIRVIANSQAEFVAAFTTILSALLDAVINVTPKIGEAFRALMDQAYLTIKAVFPKWLTLGWELLNQFLSGLNKNMPNIVSKGADIIVKFLNGVAEKMPKIVSAGANLIVKFIEGIADNHQKLTEAAFKAIIKIVNGTAEAIDEYAPELRAAGRRLGVAILDGMTGGLASKAESVVNKVRGVASSAIQGAKNLLGIRSPSRVFMEVGKNMTDGMAVGLVKYKDHVSEATEEVVGLAITTMQDSMRNVAYAVTDSMDIDPTVRPVIDLTEVNRGVDNMERMFDAATLKASVTYSQASSASAERTSAIKTADAINESTTASIIFQQTNNSPKALNTIDIYRNTRNQLSLAKEALSA